MRRADLFLVAAAVVIAGVQVIWEDDRASLFAASTPTDTRHSGFANQDNCLTCHFGIEDMHPWEELSCTTCHGGDGTAETKEKAHVAPRRKLPGDERVLPLDYDPEYLRFRNPSNLRVVQSTCGQCHAAACADLERSLHGTTAGHLSDGMYEAGLLTERGSQFGMFAIKAWEEQDSDTALEKLSGLPSFDKKEPPDEFRTHYRDLVPKNCVRCHLYAPGVAVRGRLGLDGDYRSEGCATCHVTYADDGLSKTGDPTVDRFEPGHPIRHEMTMAIPTSTCTHCHYGDASIGLNFRGLAQLHPGQPAGPEVPGTTDAQLNQAFYINDPAVTPPDVHHTTGMACIDCHTVADVMGDGNLYGQMPQAVEIECTDCHGTPEQTSRLTTSRGRPLEHLAKEEGLFYLTSKVTGEKHLVKQAAHVVNARHPHYNAAAAAAMTSDHGRLECYTCHGGWSPNFFGFHFDRNQEFSQLDMMTGERTPGRVTTQEKVFSTFRGLYLGWNSDGMIAPYMVGFSSMGTVRDEKGEVIIDQEMPVTHAGLSGMTLIHHQLHTVQSTARACVDCHRNPTALGLGSPDANFKLGRSFAFVGSSRGMDVFGLDRKQIANSLPIATLPMLGVVDVEVQVEPLQGQATRAYLSVQRRGVAVVDLTNPAFPIEAGFLKLGNARSSLYAAGMLYVAAGPDGTYVADVSDPSRPRVLSQIRGGDARDVRLNWPHLYVADYDRGLVVIDVSNPNAPETLAVSDLNGAEEDANQATRVSLLVMPGRPGPTKEDNRRTQTRVIAALACNEHGLKVVDVTEPRVPRIFSIAYEFLGGGGPSGQGNLVTAVAGGMHVDLGSPDGAILTAERDYLYVTSVTRNRQLARLFVVDVTDVRRPKAIGDARIGSYPSDVAVMHLFNPPFLQSYALVTTGSLLEIIDVTKSKGAEGVAQFSGFLAANSVSFEAMPLDRLVDEGGGQWKDISHGDSRYFSRLEIDKILRAEIPITNEGPVTPTPGGNPRSGR